MKIKWGNVWENSLKPDNYSELYIDFTNYVVVKQLKRFLKGVFFFSKEFRELKTTRDILTDIRLMTTGTFFLCPHSPKDLLSFLLRQELKSLLFGFYCYSFMSVF